MHLHVIQTGFFKLDGGAMFGVVPKSIWQKSNPPDENNLCTWALRCLLIEDERKVADFVARGLRAERFAIDVAFITRSGRIVKIRSSVPAWRMTASLRAFAVLELAAGSLSGSDTKVGDQLIVRSAY
jgi:hypothetical protein